MLPAFVRLGLITVATVILIVFAVVFVRVLGSQQAFAPPPHPWFEQAYWTVYQPADACADFGHLKPETLLMITTHYEHEEWRTNCGTLDQLLKSQAHPNWILRVVAHDSTYLDSLVDIVGKYDAKKKFGLVSDSQRAARFLRKKGPQWLYAADPASMVRMQLFASLWIETAMDFWPDFVFASPDPKSPAYLSERLAKEMEKRQKRIIWEGSEPPPIPVQGRVTSVVP